MRSKSPPLDDPLSSPTTGEKTQSDTVIDKQHVHPSFRSRAVVFDCLHESVDILSQENIALEIQNGVDLRRCALPPRAKEVALFVDAKTQSKVTTIGDCSGYPSVFMTKIYLDQLGFVNNLVRTCGFLRSIYVRNIEHLNKTSYVDDFPASSAEEESGERSEL